MKTPEISVIIPVFKVSSFIENCAVALLEQDFEDAEFIFVDDASPDDSIEKLRAVIEKYPGKNVRILTHPSNTGLPGARKTGFEASKGKYIYNCDADDRVEPGILRKLYDAAETNGADFVYCDFFLTFGENERHMRNPAYTTPDEMLRKGFLAGDCKYNWWNKLIRRDLFEGIEFPVEHFKGGEDMVVIEILAGAGKIAYVPEPLYHYVKTNSGAISEGFSDLRLESILYNSSHVIKRLGQYGSDLSEEINLFKLNVKLPFLFTTDKRKYRIWKEWFPEANGAIFKNTELPLRTKMLQWFASRNLWFAVRAYYIFVYKFVYGIIFR